MYSLISNNKQQLIAVVVLLSHVFSISAIPLADGQSAVSPPSNTNSPVASNPSPSVDFDKTYNFQEVSHQNNKMWFSSDTEGLAVDKSGNVYGGSFGEADASGKRPLNTIGRIDAVSNNANMFYEDPEKTAYIGGMRFFRPSNANGGVLMTDIVNHRVIEVTWNSNVVPTTISLKDNANAVRRVACENKEMIQPNDLAVANSGRFVYLSGLRGTNESGEGDLWFCDTKTGKMTRLDLMGRTNGIELSTRGDSLYVSEAVGGWTPSNNRIWRYRLDLTTGLPTGKKELFFDFKSFDNTGNIDINGIKSDDKDLLYVTRMSNSEVTVISPKGDAVSRIKTPFKRVADLSFGGSNGMTMYISGPCDAQNNGATTGGCLYKSSSSARGSAWAQLQQQ